MCLDSYSQGRDHGTFRRYTERFVTCTMYKSIFEFLFMYIHILTRTCTYMYMYAYLCVFPPFSGLMLLHIHVYTQPLYICTLYIHAFLSYCIYVATALSRTLYIHIHVKSGKWTKYHSWVLRIYPLANILHFPLVLNTIGASVSEPPPVVSEPPPVVSEPPPVVSEPPPVVSEPPPVVSEPPPVVSELPPVVSEPPPVVSEPPPVELNAYFIIRSPCNVQT